MPIAEQPRTFDVIAYVRKDRLDNHTEELNKLNQFWLDSDARKIEVVPGECSIETVQFRSLREEHSSTEETEQTEESQNLGIMMDSNENSPNGTDSSSLLATERSMKRRKTSSGSGSVTVVDTAVTWRLSST